MKQTDRPLLSVAAEPHDNLADIMLPLFSHAGPATDQEIENYVSSLIQSFLRSEIVRTGNGLSPDSRPMGDCQIPVQPSSLAQYLAFLATDVVPYSIHTSSPHCLSNMTPPPPNFVQVIGRLLLGMNQNMVKFEASGVMSRYERQALSMLHRLIFQHSDEFYRHHSQHSESTLGIVVSGGTLANITALWCARNAALGPHNDFG